MLVGLMVRKEHMKNKKWISFYKNRNLVIGLQVGFKGKAQIGKSMMAILDEIAAMLQAKLRIR